ncbi:MAG: hypothetical protein HQK77_02990 [Desulfobacterales bacterium]|nr:hypothetical protein [Desulfobacterales bacterium]
MKSKWIVWSFFPMLNWVAWIHVGIKTKSKYFYILGLIYAIPFLLYLLFDPKPGTQFEDSLMTLCMISWIAGIVHTQHEKKTINQQIYSESIQSDPMVEFINNSSFQSSKKDKGMTVETALLKAASENNGQLTIAKAALLTSLPTDIIQQELNKLSDKGVAVVDVDENSGHMIYRFPGLG